MVNREERVRIIGSDNLVMGDEKLSCYVVETPDTRHQDGVIRFWITPKEGFRCVQSLFGNSKRRRLRRIVATKEQ